MYDILIHIFLSYAPFIVMMKYWLYSLCCTNISLQFILYIIVCTFAYPYHPSPLEYYILKTDYRKIFQHRKHNNIFKYKNRLYVQMIFHSVCFPVFPKLSTINMYYFYLLKEIFKPHVIPLCLPTSKSFCLTVGRWIG